MHRWCGSGWIDVQDAAIISGKQYVTVLGGKNDVTVLADIMLLLADGNDVTVLAEGADVIVLGRNDHFTSSFELNNIEKKEENKISELGPQRMLYLFIRGIFHTSTRAHPLHFFMGLLFHHSTCIRFASPVRCHIHFAASHLGIFYLLPIFDRDLHLVTNLSRSMRLHQQVDPLR